MFRKQATDRFLRNVSKSTSRAYLHAVILLAGAGVFLAGILWWQTTNSVPEAVDKILHYRLGQVLAVSIFYFFYICIVVRVLIAGRNGRSMSLVLLCLPGMIVLALFAAFAFVFVMAVLKEFFDLGTGPFDWLDIQATLDGVMTIVPFIMIIIALTPILIPLDILLQIPRLVITDMRTGVTTLDNYIKESKWHKKGKHFPEVLIIEDDIDCAAVAMNFCRNMNLKCYHVASASEGIEYIYEHADDISLVLLDNFLRVDKDGNNMTGSELLLKISEDYPIEYRCFSVVITSGHTEMLDKTVTLADKVMQKPWSPAEMINFLKGKGIIKGGATSASGTKIFCDTC